MDKATMDKKTVEGLFEFAMEVTHPKKETKDDLKGKFIINGDFGCHNDSVKKLVEDIFREAGIQKTVSFAVGKEARYKVGMVVVPLSCPNSHDYELNKPCMIIEGNRAIKMDGSYGNNLPVLGLNEEHVRLASVDEIKLFAEAVSKKVKKIIVFGEKMLIAKK